MEIRRFASLVAGGRSNGAALGCARFRSTLLLISAVALLPGCVLVEPAREMTRQSMKVFKLRPSDYRDGTEEVTDPWVEEVGVDARGNRPRETDPDPWWTTHVMSEKARSIERNLGID